MTDIFSEEKRSEIMSHIKSSHNKTTEEKLIFIFHEFGIKGWRRKYKVFGKPDFIFPKQRVAVFVDGCFWHGHDCRNTQPKQNSDFWQKKISRNKERDKEVTLHLEKLGWTVLRIWECELKKKNTKNLLSRLTFAGLYKYFDPNIYKV
jgi:DNA mismatch endonuclease (patch repair protein)